MANVVMLGYALQLGVLPVGGDALRRAIDTLGARSLPPQHSTPLLHFHLASRQYHDRSVLAADALGGQRGLIATLLTHLSRR